MRVMMVTGVRNDGQHGALRRKKGGAGAGVRLLKAQQNITNGKVLRDVFLNAYWLIN